jgi:hypothetical protein
MTLVGAKYGQLHLPLFDRKMSLLLFTRWHDHNGFTFLIELLASGASAMAHQYDHARRLLWVIDPFADTPGTENARIAMCHRWQPRQRPGGWASRTLQSEAPS